MRQDSWYQGSRSEIIGEYLLSNIAFTVPVVARSDIGVDLFCTLYEIEKVQRNKNLIPSSTFAIQIKSKDNPIILSKSHIDYLTRLELPFFIGVVDRKKVCMKIYSCQQLLHLSLKYGNLADSDADFEIELKPIDDYSENNLKNNLFKLISDNYRGFKSLLLDRNNKLIRVLIKKKKEKKKEISQIALEIGPKTLLISPTDRTDIKRKNKINQLKEWVSLDYTNKYNIKTYVPIIPVKLYKGDTPYIEYYNPKNYELNVYHYLAVRLTMLFLHFSKNKTLLNENKEIILNLEKFVELVLNKIEKDDFYYKQLVDHYNKLKMRLEEENVK